MRRGVRGGAGTGKAWGLGQGEGVWDWGGKGRLLKIADIILSIYPVWPWFFMDAIKIFFKGL